MLLVKLVLALGAVGALFALLPLKAAQLNAELCEKVARVTSNCREFEAKAVEDSGSSHSLCKLRPQKRLRKACNKRLRMGWQPMKFLKFLA